VILSTSLLRIFTAIPEPAAVTATILITARLQPEVNADFSSHLDRVEREQRVVDVPRSSSEKYQYAASLAAQGVDTEGIAAALKMAPAEVEQLLKLSQLRRQVQG
jgi:hypothetical protein